MISEPITPEQAAPLLRVMGKLHHVTIVDKGPYLQIGFPYLCWLDAKPFHPLTGVLARYPGALKWGTFVNLPRRCLVVEPNVRRGESPFVVSGLVPNESSKEVVQLADRLQKFGIPTPWRNAPYVDLKEFERQVLLEIPKVADFVDKELALAERPSFGVEVSHATLELPLMEDRDGPGQGVILVADPLKYAWERAETSKNDRALHYWITDEESNQLFAEIARTTEQGDPGWTLLSRIIATEYESQIVLPSEVSDLEAEIVRLQRQVNRPSLNGALDRIASVCRSAQNYRLGIYIPARSG